MYHAHKATKLHDKIYALLGMSSVDHEVASLEPDYSLGWEILMYRLVKFLLGNQVSIETWKDKQLAVIKSDGYILGKISKVESHINSSGNLQNVEAVFGSTSGEGGDRVVPLTFRTSVKSVQVGDLICSLSEASESTIVRLHKDFFEVIIIAAVLPEQMRSDDRSSIQPEFSKSSSFARDLLLVWDWENSLEKFQDSYDIWTQTNNLQSEHSETESQGRLNNTIRRWNIALLFGDLGEWERAENELHGAVADYIEEKHNYTQNEKVVKLLLETGKTEVGSMGHGGWRLLSYAASKGTLPLLSFCLTLVRLMSSRRTNMVRLHCRSLLRTGT